MSTVVRKENWGAVVASGSEDVILSFPLIPFFLSLSFLFLLLSEGQLQYSLQLLFLLLPQSLLFSLSLCRKLHCQTEVRVGAGGRRGSGRAGGVSVIYEHPLWDTPRMAAVRENQDEALSLPVLHWGTLRNYGNLQRMFSSETGLEINAQCICKYQRKNVAFVKAAVCGLMRMLPPFKTKDTLHCKQGEKASHQHLPSSCRQKLGHQWHGNAGALTKGRT